MAEKNALGKGFDGLGLNSLFESSTQKFSKDDVYQELALDSLSPCLTQPRKYFNEDQLKELASSIQEQGIVQPLVVRPLEEEGRYEIVAGERRFRAARMLNLEKVPVVVRNYTESEAMTIALIENIQREDLNPIEEAEAYALLKEKYQVSQEVLAKSLGKSRSALANSMRLLNLPPKMRELVFQKKLSAAHGRTLLALHNKDLQELLAERILKHSLSVRDAENLAEYANAYQTLPKENSLTTLSQEEQSASALSAENAQENVETNQEQKARRRVVAKSEFLLQLQKQLRKEVHRGTKISGTIENGKLILPFSGQHELDHLLHLLSFEHSIQIPQAVQEESIPAFVQTVEENESAFDEFIQEEAVHEVSTDEIEHSSETEVSSSVQIEEDFEENASALFEEDSLEENTLEELAEQVFDAQAFNEEAFDEESLSLDDLDDDTIDDEDELHDVDEEELNLDDLEDLEEDDDEDDDEEDEDDNIFADSIEDEDDIFAEDKEMGETS